MYMDADPNQDYRLGDDPDPNKNNHRYIWKKYIDIDEKLHATVL